jgi:hypothetical protein
MNAFCVLWACLCAVGVFTSATPIGSVLWAVAVIIPMAVLGD